MAGQTKAERIQKQITALKEERAQAWQAQLPENVNDLAPEQARLKSFQAEQHPDVKAIEQKIAELRVQQQEGA